MANYTTVLAVEDQIVVKLKAALATSGYDNGQVLVQYAWGPNVKHEAVFLGPHPETADIRLDQGSEDPTIKAGRRQSQEDYTIVVTIWQWRPDLSSDGARTCAGAAKDLYDDIYDVFANDAQIGLTSVIRCMVVGWERTLFPFQKGWACEWRVNVNVTARLT